MSLRILVFQHLPVEHPGIFRDFLTEDGIAWDVVELDQGEMIPDLDGYDALWVMGGPMDVWEEADYPWLTLEKAAIREAVLERNLGYLGICLGHQLLADALGGNVGKAAIPEVGIMEIQQTPGGQNHPFLRGLPTLMNCLQWHGAEVKNLPAGAQVLASSPACQVQSFAVGTKALGIQYHLEVTDTTVREWGDIPAYKAALEHQFGQNALAQFDQQTLKHLPQFNTYARCLYHNWKASVF